VEPAKPTSSVTKTRTEPRLRGQRGFNYTPTTPGRRKKLVPHPHRGHSQPNVGFFADKSLKKKKNRGPLSEKRGKGAVAQICSKRVRTRERREKTTSCEKPKAITKNHVHRNFLGKDQKKEKGSRCHISKIVGRKVPFPWKN